MGFTKLKISLQLQLASSFAYQLIKRAGLCLIEPKLRQVFGWREYVPILLQGNNHMEFLERAGFSPLVLAVATSSVLGAHFKVSYERYGDEFI